MSYVTFLVGLLLAACGGYAMVFGWGIVAVERGWASMISGAALLSSGVVVMALALLIRAVARLRAALLAQAGDAAPARAAVAPPEDAPAEDAFVLAPRAEDAAETPPHALIEDVRRVVAQSIKGRPLRPAEEQAPSEAGLETHAPHAPAEPEAARREAPAPEPEAVPQAAKPQDGETAKPQDGAQDEARRPEPRPFARPPQDRRAPAERPGAGFSWPPAPDKPPAPEKFDAAPAESPAAGPRPPARALHLPRAVGLEGVSPALAARPEPIRETPRETPREPEPAPAPRDLVDDPAIIGRYESDGTAYVMYADGSIEATSGRGVFRFGSMGELKAFMESQPRG